MILRLDFAFNVLTSQKEFGRFHSFPWNSSSIPELYVSCNMVVFAFLTYLISVFREVSSWIIILVSIWLIRFSLYSEINMTFVVSWKIISVFKFIRQDNPIMFLSFLLCLWLFSCSHSLLSVLRFYFFPFLV